MRSLGRRMLPLGVLGAVVLLAGCGAAATSKPPTKARATDGCTVALAKSQVVVDATSAFRFVPAKVCLKAGGSVTWTNITADLSHTSTDEPSLAANPGDAGYPSGAHGWNLALAPGKSAQLRFDVTGVYRYFCIPHETLGMLGTIVVVR